MKSRYLFIILFLISKNIFALNISPIELFIDSNDESLTTSIKLENKTKNNIPVELKVFKRTHEEGLEKRVLSDDFLIYPPQMILKPGSKQTVRVIWLGENKVNKNIKDELAYRLWVKQVPLKVNDNNESKKIKSALNIVYEYMASIYVQPKKIKQKLDVSLKNYNADKREVEMLIKNMGTVHSLLGFFDYYAQVEGLTSLVKLKPEEKLLSTNLLPGEEKVLKLEGVKELKGKKFDLLYERKKKEKVKAKN